LLTVVLVIIITEVYLKTTFITVFFDSLTQGCLVVSTSEGEVLDGNALVLREVRNGQGLL
jgi:hypothetical protein